ncbi:MAG TPA: ribbon-helix-helix domain-containing protein [Beijerinckiaceae bacterium]|jgi:hypothetical protein
MSKQLKHSLRSIIEASAPPRSNVVQLDQPAGQPRGTLKERARQLSVYLEPAVYDQLRDIAYVERTKIHPLMLEALDLLFKNRGARSIRELDPHAPARP